MGNVCQKQKRMSVTEDFIDKFKLKIQSCREIEYLEKNTDTIIMCLLVRLVTMDAIFITIISR